MKKLISLLILLMVSTVCISQTDSLRGEILNREHSKVEIISKGRKLLLEKFLEADYKKVKEVKDYLKNHVEDEDYLTFYTTEYWLILYWTKEYEALLKDLKNNEPSLKPLPQQILPEEDFLYRKLEEKTSESKIVLRSFVKDAGLNEEEKEFILMLLETLTFDNLNPEQYQERLNEMADSFLAAYPNSVYAEFTKEHIMYKTKEADWGFGIEFFSGYGIFTDRLSENFSNNIPIGVAFEAEYKKINFSLRNYIGFGKLKKNIPFNDGDWVEDSRYGIFVPELAVGYSILDNKSLKIIPFVGIGGASFSASEEDRMESQSLQDMGADISVNYTAGLGVDFKLSNNLGTLFGNEEKGCWYIRLRYAYATPQLGTRFEGNMHNITIGFGGFGRIVKRDN